MTTRTTDCWFVFEKGEHLANVDANPILEYATLPYAIHYDGEPLSDEEVKRLVNAEQKRQGKALVDTLRKGATDVAEQVRAGVGG